MNNSIQFDSNSILVTQNSMHHKSIILMPIPILTPMTCMCLTYLDTYMSHSLSHYHNPRHTNTRTLYRITHPLTNITNHPYPTPHFCLSSYPSHPSSHLTFLPSFFLSLQTTIIGHSHPPKPPSYSGIPHILSYHINPPTLSLRKSFIHSLDLIRSGQDGIG